VLLTAKVDTLEDELSEVKGEMKDGKQNIEDMMKKIKQYEDERPQKRSINDITDGAEGNLERECKKRTVILEY
jgi:hypothetical protein